jgi:DNA-binding transcriptional MocR family regulator
VIEQAGPRDKLPTLAQIAAASGVSRTTAARACQELARMGLVCLIPGHGYYPGTRRRDARPDLRALRRTPRRRPAAPGPARRPGRHHPRAADTTFLDELPLLGDILPGLPPRLKAELFDAFDLHIWRNKPGGQATIRAELTEATLQALPFLLDPTHDAPGPGPMCHLGNAPIVGTMAHRPGQTW